MWDLSARIFGAIIWGIIAVICIIVALVVFIFFGPALLLFSLRWEKSWEFGRPLRKPY